MIAVEAMVRARAWFFVFLMAQVACKADLGKVAPAKTEGALEVSHLRWDGSDHALGVPQFEPRLDWLASSSQRGERQTAYQVLVASDIAKLTEGAADIWDSGKVTSSDSLNVRYGGPTLAARQRGLWTVRVWDRAGLPSSFSPAARFDMGPYDEEVEAEWIGRKKRTNEAKGVPDRSVTYLRRSLHFEQAVRDARLYASAFGLYDVSINGRRVTSDVLSPGVTDHSKRVLYQTRDVTPLLEKGENVIGVVLGGGTCTAGIGGAPGSCGSEPPRVMVLLEAVFADGSRQSFESDDGWRYHAGPIVSSHLSEGEIYDARLEMPGWDAPGFDARGWAPAEEYDEGNEHNVYADRGPAIHVAEDVEAVAVTGKARGAFVVDFGRSIVGWAKIAVAVPPGTTVALRYFDADASGAPPANAVAVVDRYTAKGGAEEVWEPRFSVHAFRFVEVSGLADRAALASIRARAVRSETPRRGTLETSSQAIDRLFESIVRSQEGAFLSVPTAGSERRERVGAMLETQAFAMTSCLNSDVQGFYRKWLDDIRDAQHPNAAYSDLAPHGERAAGYGSGSAGVLVPWAQFRCYADRAAIDGHLASMGRWLEHVRSQNPDGIWRSELGDDVGDPLETGPGTDHALLATTELAEMQSALAQMIRHGGGDLARAAEPYAAGVARTRAAFRAAFALPGGRLRSDTQTAYAAAIARGMLEGDERKAAGERLAETIERADRHPTTGLLGTPLLLPALSLAGKDDLAYALLLQPTCPSWLCALGDPSLALYSTRHLAFASVGEWMYDAIGGIALDPLAPAGRHFFVRPRPGGGLTHARASYESLHGTIRTEWSLEGGQFRLKITVPAGSTASVSVPFGGQEVEVASGTYDFSSRP